MSNLFWLMLRSQGLKRQSCPLQIELDVLPQTAFTPNATDAAKSVLQSTLHRVPS